MIEREKIEQTHKKSIRTKEQAKELNDRKKEKTEQTDISIDRQTERKTTKKNAEHSAIHTIRSFVFIYFSFLSFFSTIGAPKNF